VKIHSSKSNIQEVISDMTVIVCPCSIGCGCKYSFIDFVFKSDDKIVALLCMKNNAAISSEDMASKMINACDMLKNYTKENRYFNFFIPQSNIKILSRHNSPIGNWQIIRKFINDINSLDFFHNKIDECKQSYFPTMQKFFVKGTTLHAFFDKNTGLKIF